MTTTIEVPPAFTLTDAGLSGPAGRVLELGDWGVRDRAVTALVGPAGTGKSTLLRALAGQPLPDGFVARGAWLHRGKQIAEDAGDIAWVPQAKHSPIRASAVSDVARRARKALGNGAITVLLDEPSRGLTSGETDELVIALRAHAKRGAAVVVTHDLAFARRIADYVCMACAGAIDACTDATAFFEAPATDMARRFLEQGNCWPSPTPPPLPSHFHWIVSEQLAGMGRPGLLGEVDEDLAAIAAAGITQLVSLTEEPFSAATLRAYGIGTRHFPIPDMGVPAVGPSASLCRDIERMLRSGERVALHCHAGLGRTGTMLATMMVWLGDSPESAIERVRAISNGYIQTSAQLAFVVRFAGAFGVEK